MFPTSVDPRAKKKRIFRHPSWVNSLEVMPVVL
jgi:hypothetical protein